MIYSMSLYLQYVRWEYVFLPSVLFDAYVIFMCHSGISLFFFIPHQNKQSVGTRNPHSTGALFQNNHKGIHSE